MIRGFDENGELRNARVTEEGALVVSIEDSSDGGTSSKKETTLYAGMMTVTTTEQTIGVSKKVTEISIANYSETANITISVDETDYTIGPNLALELPINKSVSIIGLTSTEADTKVQYVIKGEE